MTCKSSRTSPRTSMRCSIERQTPPCTLSRLPDVPCIVAATAIMRDPMDIITRLSSEKGTEVVCTTTRRTRLREWTITWCTVESSSMNGLVKLSPPRKTRVQVVSTTLPTLSTAHLTKITANSWTIRSFHPLTMSPNRIIISLKIRIWTFQTSCWRVMSIRTSRPKSHHQRHSRRELKSCEEATTRRLPLSASTFKTTTSSRKCSIRWASRGLVRSRTSNNTTTSRDKWATSKDWALESHRNTATAA